MGLATLVEYAQQLTQLGANRFLRPEARKRGVEMTEGSPCPPEVVVQHQEEPALSLVEACLARRPPSAEHVAIQPHTLGIVDVQHSAQRSQEVAFVRLRA
jgi:hypothetical protein